MHSPSNDFDRPMEGVVRTIRACIEMGLSDDSASHTAITGDVAKQIQQSGSETIDYQISIEDSYLESEVTA